MAVRLIFVAVYAVLAVGRLPWLRVDRTAAAVIGGVAMVAVGALGLDDAARAVDVRTVVLLFGMMVLVATLRLGHFFRVLAQAIVAHIENPVLLVAAIVGASGLLSALFVNDTVCLAFTPILIETCAARRQDPVPFLLALATASNIGSAATLTGNPQNMLIGSVSHVGYATFLARLLPVSLFGLAVDVALVAVIFRGRLRRGEAAAMLRPPRPIHRMLTAKALVVASGMLAGFLAGVEPALVAAVGAAILLVTRWVRPDRIYLQVDWALLLLFIGLFIVIGGAVRAGVDQELFAWLQPLGVSSIRGLMATAAVLSNLISNVPAVMLFVHVVPRLPDPGTSWLALALASTLAGNLTLLGSIANLIVVESAKREGVRVTFVDYLKIGVPITIVTLAFGLWWVGPR